MQVDFTTIRTGTIEIFRCKDERVLSRVRCRVVLPCLAGDGKGMGDERRTRIGVAGGWIVGEWGFFFFLSFDERNFGRFGSGPARRVDPVAGNVIKRTRDTEPYAKNGVGRTPDVQCVGWVA